MKVLTRVLLCGLAAWSVNVASHNHQEPSMNIERIFQSPSLEGTEKRELQVSPDGKRVTFLQGKKPITCGWIYGNTKSILEKPKCYSTLMI